MEKKEATYQYLEEAHGNGMFFFTSGGKTVTDFIVEVVIQKVNVL